jgi:hypothetical protein
MQRLITIAIVLLLLLGALIVVMVVRSRRVAVDLIARIESLNGAVGDSGSLFFGVDEIHFSVEGLKPLVSDEDLIDLADLLHKSRIRYVGLTNTNVTDRGFQALVESCRATLEVLEISGTRLSDQALKSLVSCSQLRQLSIPIDVLTADGVSNLGRIASLNKILVFDCRPGDERLDLLREQIGEHIDIVTYRQAHFFAR